jgi:hypothetical protein
MRWAGNRRRPGLPRNNPTSWALLLERRLRPLNERKNFMPILLWLLGVPLSVVILLVLFGVV